MITLLGYLAACLTTGSAVPQLIRTLRTRNVSGISLSYWLTLAAGVALWLVYGIVIGSGPLIAANGVSLALDLTVLIFTVRYRLVAPT